MELPKNYLKRVQQRKGANSKTADIVFSFLDKHKVEYKDGWGKKLAGAMLRKQKKDIKAKLPGLAPLMADAEERLNWMALNNKPLYKDIVSTNESKTRYFWSKFLKKK